MKLKEKTKLFKRMVYITKNCMKCSLYSAHDEFLCRDCELYLEAKEIQEKLKGDECYVQETN